MHRKPEQFLHADCKLGPFVPFVVDRHVRAGRRREVRGRLRIEAMTLEEQQRTFNFPEADE